MNTKEETVERMLLEFHRGNSTYFPLLVEECLDMVVEEIDTHITDLDLSLVALLALFCAIKSYRKEKAGDGYSYIQRYIHLTLLVYRGNPVMLDENTVCICFPTYGIDISPLEIQKYKTILQEKQRQKRQNTIEEGHQKVFEISSK